MDPRENPKSDTDANVHRTSKPKPKQKIYEYETRGRKSERKYQLKRTRAEAKAVVAKLRNELQHLMSDCENVDQVREKLNEMDISMRRFKDAHYQYHAELMDEYDIEESSEYYEYEEIKVAQLVERIAKWIDEESHRIEATIAEYMSDSIQPEDSVSNVGAQGRASPKNRKKCSITTVNRSKSSQISTSRAVKYKEAAMAVETKTTKVYPPESEEKRSELGQDREFSLVFQQPKERSKVREKLPEDQEMESSGISMNCKQPSMDENKRVYSDDGGALKSDQKDKITPRRVSKSIPVVLTKEEFKTNEMFAKSDVNNVQERREIIPRRDNDQTKLTISPQQPPVLIDSVGHHDRPDFTEIERTRGMLQSTPKESILLREREKINTTSKKEMRLPVYSKSEEFYVMREEPAKNSGSRNSADETTMCYSNTPMQQQQSLQIQQLLDQQRQHINALTLPHTEVPVFSGDPIEYCGFIRAFENLIETKTMSPSARLYYLIQFTRGDVQELMRSCLPMEASEGYEKAKSLLKSKYGQSYKISAAYAERILKAPQIKSEDGRSLQRFSVLLTSCQNTLKEIGCLNKLENPDTLQKVVEKLPYGLRQKWRDVADHITEEQNREITIQDITNFIDKKARAANHPLFGNLSTNAQDSTRNRSSTTVENKRKPFLSTARTSCATHGESPSNKPSEEKKVLKCPLCSEHHWLSRCKVFREKSLQERIKFTREKGLCDNCLVTGHMARSCPKDSFCKVEDCKLGRKHSTFLHPKNDSPDKAQNDDRTAMTKPTEAAKPNCISSQGLSGSTGAGTSNVIGMPIVPVKVKAKTSCDLRRNFT